MENRLHQIAKEALASCPYTDWTAQPIYDHDSQRLALESMTSQLEDQAARARNGVIIMVVGWSLNAKWPRTRNAPVFFTREVLTWVAQKEWHIWPGDLSEQPPPWSVAQISKFLDLTVHCWYRTALKDWAISVARDCFKTQADRFEMLYPHE